LQYTSSLRTEARRGRDGGAVGLVIAGAEEGELAEDGGEEEVLIFYDLCEWFFL